MRLMKRWTACALVFFVVTAAFGMEIAPVSAQMNELIFRSGFESGSTVDSTYKDITGIDGSVLAPNDWVLDLEGHPSIGIFNLQYEGGTPEHRWANIVDDPTPGAAIGNQVLHYWLKDAVKNSKGRIQANVYNNSNLKEMYYSHRWYVPGLVEQLVDMGNYSNLTIAEFWNDEGWVDHETPFRISVGLSISSDGEALVFRIQGQKKVGGQWRDMWRTKNEEVVLPFDQWMNVEYYFKEGDSENGKFYMSLTPEGGTKKTIFALQTLTHHPDDPAPDGLNGFNPLKMYSGMDVTSYMASRGVLQWYYDDFELWTGTPPSLDPEEIVWTQLEVANPPQPPDMDEYVMEFEDMLVTGSSPGSVYEVVYNSNLSGGAGVRLEAAQIQDYIQFATEMQEGHYEVELGVRKGPDQGIIQYWTLGGNKGQTFDLYASSEQHEVIDDFPMVSSSNSGIKATRFTIVGQNDASAGKALVVDYLKLRTIRPEPINVTIAPGNYTSGDSMAVGITYNMPVIITPGEDLPYIPLELTNGDDTYAYYVDGSGTTELQFLYEVQEGDLDEDGIIVLGSDIVLNDSSLMSERNRYAITSLPIVRASGVYVNAESEGNVSVPGVAVATEWTLYATEDTFVRTGTDPSNPFSDVDENFGSYSTLQLRDHPIGTDDRESYFKFDIRNVQGAVTEAELALHIANSNDGRAQAFVVEDDSWTESGMTWNNKPDSGVAALDAAIGLNTGNWVSFDVTAYAAAEIVSQDAAISFAVKDTTGIYRYAAFSSKENANGNKPTLQLASTITTMTPSIRVFGNPQVWPAGPVTLDLYVMADPMTQLEEVKWALGERDAAYFETNGDLLQAIDRLVIELNDAYTIFAKDELGNVSLYTFHPPVIEQHTVTFDTYGGSAIAPLLVLDGSLLTQPSPPIKGDYTFDGWYTDGNLTQAFDFVATPITGDISLYAKWVLTPPGAPVIVSATPGDAKAELVWNGVPLTTGYSIYQSTTSGTLGTLVATVTDSVYSYEATGLINGVTYYFVISALNDAGSNESVEVSLTPMSVAAAPTNVTATVAVGARATVTFTAPEYDGGSEISEYRVTSTPGNLVVTTTNTTVDITGLSYGTTYTFTVEARNTLGYGAVSIASNEVRLVAPSSGDNDTTSSIPIAGPIVSTDGEVTLPIGTAGEVKLGDAIVVSIPAGASVEELKLTIEQVSSIDGLASEGVVFASEIFELLKNFSGNFAKPVVLTFKFDVTRVQEGQHAALFYYDEDEKAWVKVGGAVKGDTITAEVDHFTKFAVLVVDEETTEQALPPFTDSSGHWAESKILEAVQLGFVSGYEDGTIKPNALITRAEFAVMLANALKLDGQGVPLGFIDKAKIGAWSREGVGQAAEAGIISGYSDNSFRPGANITRAELAVMIARAYSTEASSAGSSGFADESEIPGWARGAVSLVKKMDIVSGKQDNKFAPLDTATRAEAVTMVINLLQVKNKPTAM